MEHNQTTKRFLIGIIILVVGSAILLSNLGILNYEIKHYLLRWEMILIGLGLIIILSHENKGFGVILLMVGGAFYLRDYFDLHFNFWQVFWPAMLILAGIMILLHRRIGHHHFEKKNITSHDDVIDEVAIFGGGSRSIVSQNFQGGKILAIFGGSDFNLLRANLAPGQNYIEVLAVFGGLKLIVPEDWNVRITAFSIFGGFSDKHRIQPRESNSKPESELIIKGFVIFGGGEIRSL
jgi:predicted membrane protein